MNVASEPLSGHGLGCQGKGWPLLEVGHNRETLQSKNDGVTLTKQRHPSRPLRMSLSSGHNPSSAVTLRLSRVPHRYKYCKSLSTVCPCASFCTPLPSQLTSHTSHHSALTKCYLWFSRSFHRPFRYSKVLGCCLKCLLEIKTRFLCEAKAQLSSWPQWPSLQQSSALHKSKPGLLKPAHGITLCCSVQRYAQRGSTSP